MQFVQLRHCKLLVLAIMCLSILLIPLSGRANCFSASSDCYGSGIGADALGNTVVGGPYSNKVSYRFTAGHSGSLEKIHVYLIPNRSGYAAGTGGTIQVTVNTDDGTSAHNPSNAVLASYLLSNPLAATPSIYFPIFTFSVPPTLVAGQIYHIVFTNVDASPATNYLSVDALEQTNQPTPSQPTMSDLDAAVLVSQLGQPWFMRKGYTPILELDYQDGFSEMVGYMEVWSGVPQSISGTNAVRETFTVTGVQRTVATVSFRVARIAGSDPLTVRLENTDGTLIEQGEIPAASFPLTNPISYNWGTYTFSSARSLVAGQTYHVDLEAASSSTYQAFPIRKGSAYGFQNTTYFPDGYAQFTQDGSSWAGWTQWGATNRTDGDLQFYFALATDPPGGGSSTAPIISNVAAGSVMTSGATIAWTTDQASTSQVEYGTTTAYAYSTPVDSNMVTTHSESLTGLMSATLYHYRVHSTNASGQEAVSGDLTFTTASAPPVISNVAAGSITSSGATITWTTDQAATSQVQYGTTTAYGNSTTLDATLVTSHAQNLAGLAPGTLYHYNVLSKNAAGEQTVSGDLTFTTAAAPPVISNVAAESITSSGATITWTTDQAATSQVQYGTTTAYGSSTTLDAALVTSHAQNLTGLSPNTLYHFRVLSMNASSEQAVSGDFTFKTQKYGKHWGSRIYH